MQTVQQFRDTTGENATDSVMIIDTSDLIIPTFARPPLFDHDFVTVSQPDPIDNQALIMLP